MSRRPGPGSHLEQTLGFAPLLFGFCVTARVKHPKLRYEECDLWSRAAGPVRVRVQNGSRKAETLAKKPKTGNAQKCMWRTYCSLGKNKPKLDILPAQYQITPRWSDTPPADTKTLAGIYFLGGSWGQTKVRGRS